MKRSCLGILGALAALFTPTLAFAQTEVHVVNWYEVLLGEFLKLVLPRATEAEVLHYAEFWSPVAASIFTVFVIALLAYCSGIARIRPEKLSDEEILPPARFGVVAFWEMCWSVVASTLSSTIGEREWSRFVPVLGGIFFVMIVSSLLGIIPGFHPSTSSMSFTFAAACLVFIYFNYYGLKEAGWHYITHMAGPVLWMAPLMFLIELVSLFARPVSLSLRIFGNISGDHIVFSIFSGLAKDLSVPFLPIPAVFLGFGTFVACLQAFIFMTLSAVYIKLALESKPHHH